MNLNQIDSLMFSLRENSEIEFVISFTIDSMYIDIEKLKPKKPTLVVSLYPHKKIIELKNQIRFIKKSINSCSFLYKI